LGGESAHRKAATDAGEQKYRINANIHAFGLIWTHNSGVERAKTIHALDREATVLGTRVNCIDEIPRCKY
jgi:hypothetical protein